MKRFLLSVAVVAVVSVAATGTASANGPRGGRVVVSSVRVQATVVRPVHVNNNLVHVNNNLVHANNTLRVGTGVRFSHGVYFGGAGYGQFRSRCWNSQYNCWTFFDPITNCWYYWSARNGCYFPLNYASVVGPNGVLPGGINTLPPYQGLPPGQGFPPVQGGAPPVQPPPPAPVQPSPPADQTPPPDQTPPVE